MELRRATPADTATLIATVEEGFATYREWAPAGWAPPVVDRASAERLRAQLEEPEAWCTIALDGEDTAGHAALSLSTREEPAAPPPGAIYLWQLFVRSRWHGTGVAGTLMAAAVAEARRRGFSAMLLWTPQGAQRARGFYEREGWSATGRVHDPSHFTLPTVEYRRPLDG